MYRYLFNLEFRLLNVTFLIYQFEYSSYEKILDIFGAYLNGVPIFRNYDRFYHKFINKFHIYYVLRVLKNYSIVIYKHT